MTNTCADFKMMISRHMDGDLDASEMRAVDAHVPACERCRATMDAYTSIRELVATTYVVSESGAVTGDFRVRFDERCSAGNPGLKLAAMIALCVTLLSIGVFLRTSYRQVRSQPVVLGAESRLVMNTPLCALVYYQELAGKTVYSQYARIRSAPGILYQGSDSAACCYDSPLFHDNTVVGDRYGSLRRMSFAQ
jgi:Putative zinc-finger